MAYVGRGINNLSNAQILDTITFTGSAGPYDLEQGSAAFTPISPQALVISIDGVIQAPGSYTISSATITFDTSMASTSTNDFIVHNGVGIVNVPTDDSVTTAKIEDLAVTAGKLAATQDLSTKTITLPASVSGLGTGITNSQLAGSIDVTTKITGVVPTANLGSGSASSSTYLAGDQTYKSITAVDIAWQAVTTGTTLTAVAGRGYPINTTSNVCTVTLPASASVGDQIIFTDYARTWNTYAVTLDQGSLKYQGYDDPNPVYDTNGESVHIVYMDATQGWVPTYDGAVALETPQTYSADFLVVAGGGGGGSGGNGEGGGGGGAGGYRISTQTLTGGTVITVTVGDGGAGGAYINDGTAGDASSFSGSGLTTISSAGGGYGSRKSQVGGDGGSGGGSGSYYTSGAGAGDVPDTTPDQGNDGGIGYTGSLGYAGGGGGGHAAVGTAGTSNQGGDGGTGTDSSISGASVGYAGGGGGGIHPPAANGGSATHGGGAGTNGTGTNATANTGGGGGGAGGVLDGGNGGKGVIVISVPDANYSGTTTGSPTVATGQAGSKTTMVFTGTGSYTA